MAKKKILVTGANGLLGQKIVYKVKDRNDVELLATSRGDSRLTDTQGYTYTKMDITDAERIMEVFEDFRPDTVINTAAMTNVDACEGDKEGCRKLNIEAVGNLIQACEKYGTHLIHLSTDFIFDGEDGPYKEGDEPNPLSYYGWSKLESEKLVQKSNIKWCIIRTIIVYGIVDNMSRSNVVLWAKGALEKQEPINVVDDQFRAPTLAEDLADACISASMKEAEGIYHVSGKDIMSILELVYRVADFYGLDKSCVSPIKSEVLNQAAKRPPKTGFILDKARKELDYEPHSFEEGLEILDGQLAEKPS